MDDVFKRKFVAGGKVAVGAARVVSGVATACGVGLLGGFLRHRNMIQAAQRMGYLSIEGGKKAVNEGLAEWDRA